MIEEGKGNERAEVPPDSDGTQEEGRVAVVTPGEARMAAPLEKPAKKVRFR